MTKTDLKQTFPVISCEFDVVVAGGGIAGIASAISAARHGARTALIDNKSGLGGNAGSQIRVSINGASFFNYFPNAREGGIMEELRIALAELDPSRSYMQSSIVFWALCSKEKNLTVYPDLNIDTVETCEGNVVRIEGSQSFTECRYEFSGKQFVDATGDGTLAVLAGCESMFGREAKEMFSEQLAPDKADRGIMGSTLLFRGIREDYPVEFTRPDWAYAFESEDDLPFRLSMYRGTVSDGLWWMEWAGPDDDSIGQHHVIQQDLWRYVYGIWDFFKRDPSRKMENYRLESVGLVPGKRESRRICGDYIMTEQDIISGRKFDDAIAYGGWNLDLHAPSGIKSKEPPNVHAMFPWLYTIPLRSCCSKDVENLWLAGRCMSVSHVALGAVRLQGTLGLCGEAIGISAAMAAQKECSAREIAAANISEIQQEILKGGLFIPGVVNSDENDLARNATVSASSARSLILTPSEDWILIRGGKAVSFPVTEGRLEKISIVLKNGEDDDVEVRLRLASSRHPNDFLNRENLVETIIQIKPGIQTVDWKIQLNALPSRLYALYVETAGDVEWMLAEETPLGVYFAEYNPDKYSECIEESSADENKPFAFANTMFLSADNERCDWQRIHNHRDVLPGSPPQLDNIRCGWFETVPVQRPYEAENVINGISQSEIMPNLWVSEPADGSAELVLEWESIQSIRELHLILDRDMNMDQPHYYAPPTLISDITVCAQFDGGWTEVSKITGNRQRRCVVPFDSTVTTSAIKLVCTKINRDGLDARIYEVRCY